MWGIRFEAHRPFYYSDIVTITIGFVILLFYMGQYRSCRGKLRNSIGSIVLVPYMLQRPY